MSAFAAALARWNVATYRRVQDAFVFSTEEVERSVKFGSELTGAPGQPVQTGNLLSSWQGAYEGPTLWALTTTGRSASGEPVGYAEHIENGGNARGPFTLRSQVGGFHSVKLTAASWDRIVEFAARKAGSG